ncbi:hypothetical protein B0J17DRAFT_723638 [Rhizoctonia solani]|nr:hypothetical protein B0J17DRAFT_723638 [Rhizoctonia solani]
MSETHSVVEPLPEEVGATSAGPIPPVSEAPVLPTQPSKALQGDANGTNEEEKSNNPTNGQTGPKESNLSDPKPDTERRKSTIKHQEPANPKSSHPRPQNGRRPPQKRRGSTTSVQSRYSEMTMDYFDAIPAKYNAYASFFTWILLSGFVLGPGAQTATGGSSRRRAGMVVLGTSIACSGVGVIGMLFLWFKWRKNYVWLIHKIFLPGASNGLTGTLAVSINIWAGGGFSFNTSTIVTLSITVGATVICLLLTLIYKIALLSVKKEHMRLVREAVAEDEEANTGKKESTENDHSIVQDSIWSALTN